MTLHSVLFRCCVWCRWTENLCSSVENIAHWNQAKSSRSENCCML